MKRVLFPEVWGLETGTQLKSLTAGAMQKAWLGRASNLLVGWEPSPRTRS